MSYFRASFQTLVSLMALRGHTANGDPITQSLMADELKSGSTIRFHFISLQLEAGDYKKVICKQ